MYIHVCTYAKDVDLQPCKPQNHTSPPPTSANLTPPCARSVVSILAVPRDAFEPLAASFKSQIHAVQVNLSRRIEREMQQTLRVALDTCDPSTPL
eukprot:50226-Chlamydomonas_euryale.AAC.1